jgi:hypothetical protein
MLTEKKQTNQASIRTGHGGRQQDVENEDKICASYNWNIRNNKEGITSEQSVAPKSPAGHGTTEDYANEHCTHHL